MCAGAGTVTVLVTNIHMDMDGVLCWYAGGGACMDAYEMVAIGSRQSFGCAVGLRYPDDDKRTSLAVSLVGDELSFFVLFVMPRASLAPRALDPLCPTGD